jgi:hypothetical protein
LNGLTLRSAVETKSVVFFFFTDENFKFAFSRCWCHNPNPVTLCLGQSAHDPDSSRGVPSFATSRRTSKLQQTIVMASTLIASIEIFRGTIFLFSAAAEYSDLTSYKQISYSF